MAEKSPPANDTAEPVLSITRIFNAPRSLVFQAWTQPEHLKHWQGAPQGFTVTSHQADMRPGGAYKLCMRSPEGTDHWLQGVYRVIVENQRMVFTHTWLDAQGKPGKETLVTLTFNERDGKTELILHQTGFKSAQSRDGHMGGWNSMLDRLAGHIESEPLFVISRIFDAPPVLVYEAWTDPRHMAQWWGPHHFTNPVCELDVRPGGKWRIVMHSPDGIEHPCKGVYREIVPPERLIYTVDHSELSDQWHDMVNPHRDKSKAKPKLEAVDTVTFEDINGKTRLTIRRHFESVAVRNAMLKIGMNEGWSQSFERLEQITTRADVPFVIERMFDAPVAAVWHAITEKDAMKQWYFDLPEFKPQVGFAFQFSASDKGITYLHHCVITEVIPQKKLAYNWRYEGHEGNSLVTFELFGEGDKTKVKLTHAGLHTFPAIPPFARANFSMGWTYIIDSGLKGFVEKRMAK